MKRLAACALALLCLVSCGGKGGFVDFFPDSYYHLSSKKIGDPLTIKHRIPGTNWDTIHSFSVYRAEIIGIAETKDNMGSDSLIDTPYHTTYFNIHVTYDYTSGTDMNQYAKAPAPGTEAYQKYGIPLPEVGDTVILGEMNLDYSSILGFHSPYYYVITGEDGVEYCYSTVADTSCFTGGIELVGEERHVYKKGRDDDIIKYLEENNIRMPEMTHKFKLEDLIPQLIEINIPHNEAVENGTITDDKYDEVKQNIWIEYDYGEEGDSE